MQQIVSYEEEVSLLRIEELLPRLKEFSSAIVN